MKNKKGFTLVEMLAVVCILGALIAIAVPSVIYVSNRLKKKMYCTKLETIETSAKLYGEDNIGLLNIPCTINSQSYSECLTTDIESLFTNNYIKDDNNSGDVLDPRTNNSIKDKTVYIYKKNNRVNAKIVDEDCD